MKILMISTDRKIFEDGSLVNLRICEYGSLFEELHVIVFSMKKLKLKRKKLDKNVHVYPTNAYFKPFYLSKAFRVAKQILKKNLNSEWMASTQDPFETGLVGLRIKKRFKIPLQVQLHGDFGNPLFKQDSKLNRLRLGMAEKVLKKADCTRAVSKRVSIGIQNKFELKKAPVLLPIMINAEKIKNEAIRFDIHKKYPKFDFIVLMSSRIEKVKNIELAIHAFSEVLKKYKQIGLIILGDGTQRKNLEKLVKDRGIEESVCFEGWVDESEKIVSYLKTTDLFLNTSNHEGYCSSLIEAALSKCAILTTNVGVVGEEINETNSLVCKVGDRVNIFVQFFSF